MADRTRKVRFSVAIAGASFSYAPGEEVTAGAPGQIDLDEAGRYVSAGAAEWVESRDVETATRKTPERATTRRRKKE